MRAATPPGKCLLLNSQTPRPSASAQLRVRRDATAAGERPAEPTRKPHTLIANPPLTLFALHRSGVISAYDGLSFGSVGVESDRRGDTSKHEVCIATRTDEAANAVIEVGDTGVGIDPEVLPRIFDPFFTSKGPGQGVGLGLSISLGTVKALGGDIHVSSEPERGTRFRVVLPSAKGWRAAHPASPTEGAALERKQVLVVDDDRLVGEALGRALASIANVEEASMAGHAHRAPRLNDVSRTRTRR